MMGDSTGATWSWRFWPKTEEVVDTLHGSERTDLIKNTASEQKGMTG